MKTLLLVRHAIPEIGSFQDDALRPLSDKGREVQKRMTILLLENGYRPDKIYYSPYQRTKETAEILAEAFHVLPQEEPLLAPGYDEQLIVDKCLSLPGTIILVGHAPSLARIAAILLKHSKPLFEPERSGTLVVDGDNKHEPIYYSPRDLH